ncbi:MAG: hypothetical protein ACK5NA_06395 [Enterococcus sp.]
MIKLNKETVVLGNSYECQAVGLKRRVTGEVVQKLNNCVVLCVEDFAGIDIDNIQEASGKVVAKYADIYGPKVAGCFFS